MMPLLFLLITCIAFLFFESIFAILYADKKDLDYLKTYTSAVSFVAVCDSNDTVICIREEEFLKKTLGKVVYLQSISGSINGELTPMKSCLFVFSSDTFPDPWKVLKYCLSIKKNSFAPTYLLLPILAHTESSDLFPKSGRQDFSGIQKYIKSALVSKKEGRNIDESPNLDIFVSLNATTSSQSYFFDIINSGLAVLLAGELKTLKPILSIAVTKQYHKERYMYLTNGTASGLDFIRTGGATKMGCRTGTSALFIPQTNIYAELLVLNVPSKALCNECHESDRLLLNCPFNLPPIRDTTEFVDPFKVDWNKFDVVMSMDITIPVSVTKAHPNVLWTYYESEGCMNLGSQYTEKGYDVYLTQNLREIPSDQPNVFEVPYILALPYLPQIIWPNETPRSPVQSGRCMAALDRGTNEYFRAQGANSSFLVKLAKFCSVLELGGTDKQYHQKLGQAHFFIVFGKSMHRGNALIEAALAQLLVVGNFYGQINRPIFDLNSFLSNIWEEEELLVRLQAVWNNSELYNRFLRQQNARVFLHGFVEPLSSFLRAVHKKRAHNIRHKKNHTSLSL